MLSRSFWHFETPFTAQSDEWRKERDLELLVRNIVLSLNRLSCRRLVQPVVRVPLGVREGLVGGTRSRDNCPNVRLSVQLEKPPKEPFIFIYGNPDPPQSGRSPNDPSLGVGPHQQNAFQFSGQPRTPQHPPLSLPTPPTLMDHGWT
ncbi:hypothetical protein AVEN_200456-1 [Araneus ventricosus]|uniref:Uncharacterized protein n=1 Tax=Araneus ventricosus TaxID=182803 RepID=A0A4Y2JJD8_ARAVE|nr:hypothetical protein AVEN_200456-1 [Araneus ventricosus]